MQLDSLYQEIILDHYRSPHHAGLAEPYDVEVHHVNPSCGDEVTLRVELDGDTVLEGFLVRLDAPLTMHELDEGVEDTHGRGSILADEQVGQH